MKIVFGLLLVICGLSIAGCRKHSDEVESVTKLYKLDVDQIKYRLSGTWYVRSECNTTIAGTSCRTPEFESLTFTPTDSLIWVKDNALFKNEKIDVIRIVAPKNQGYTVDSLYVFKLKESKISIFPYEIKNDSLIFKSPTNDIDAGYRVVLTKFNTNIDLP